MFTKQSEKQILEWLHDSNLNKFCRYLISGSIHGKPGIPVAELARLEKIIKREFEDEDQYRIGKDLLQREEYTARNLGSHLIVSGWPRHKDVEHFAKIAADDPNWIVREYAAGAFAALLEKDFTHFTKLFSRWISTESVNVKRACLSRQIRIKNGRSTEAKTLLGIDRTLVRGRGRVHQKKSWTLCSR